MEDLKTTLITMIIINCFSIIHTTYLFKKKQRELHIRSLLTEEPEEKKALLIVEKNFLKRYVAGSIIFCAIWDIILFISYLSNQPGTGF